MPCPSLTPSYCPYQLYCQNLSLFGKLFIDIKTLFFDCDNCEAFITQSLRVRGHTLISGRDALGTVLFYILTDADSQRDHVLGFFSKVIIDSAEGSSK